MKKFYVTLVALLIATVSFAQVTNLSFIKKEANTQNEPAIKKVVPFHPNQSKGVAASTWFSYFPEFFQYYFGIELGAGNYSFVSIHCDTNVQIHYSDGDASVQFCGFGQIFSFADNFWQVAVQTAHGIDPSNSLPDMTSATTYSVDSISIPYLYWRGSLQPDNAIDSIVVSVLGDLTEADLDYEVYTSFVHSQIKYDTVNFVLKEIPGKKYFAKSFPLLDTVVDQELFCDFALPGFTNISNKNLVVFYTYKPGIRANHNQFMGDEVGVFRGLVYHDPRTGEYAIGDGTLATTERNNSFNAVDYTFSGWPELLLPTSMWDLPYIMRPAIYAKITCDNCSMGSITEMAKKNVTISPNPATSNFTVDLGAAGKSNVEMFNLVGQKVYSNSTNDASITVNVSDFKSGVYMLKINQNGQVYTSKVVVK
jgi:hypothetical protein